MPTKRIAGKSRINHADWRGLQRQAQPLVRRHRKGWRVANRRESDEHPQQVKVGESDVYTGCGTALNGCCVGSAGDVWNPRYHPSILNLRAVCASGVHLRWRSNPAYHQCRCTATVASTLYSVISTEKPRPAQYPRPPSDTFEGVSSFGHSPLRLKPAGTVLEDGPNLDHPH